MMKKLFLLGALICTGHMYGMEPIEPNNPYKKLKTWFGFGKTQDIERKKTARERIEFFEELKLLPLELQQEAVKTALLTSKNIDETVAIIEAASKVLVHYNNLRDFNRLVHILADKFEISTEAIAKKFETPISKAYLNLNEHLAKSMEKSANFAESIELLKRGGDINFTNDSYVEFLKQGQIYSPQTAKIYKNSSITNEKKQDLLQYAVKIYDIESIKLLIELGIIPKAILIAQSDNERRITVLEDAKNSMSSKDPDYPRLLESIKVAKEIKQIFEEATKHYPPSLKKQWGHK